MVCWASHYRLFERHVLQSYSSLGIHDNKANAKLVRRFWSRVLLSYRLIGHTHTIYLTTMVRWTIICQTKFQRVQQLLVQRFSIALIGGQRVQHGQQVGAVRSILRIQPVLILAQACKETLVFG